MKIPKVSIVILNHNGLKDTIVCLRSILISRYKNFEVLVVDNGSSENEKKILEKKFTDKRLWFYRIDKNLGYTGGNNWALTRSSGSYVVFLNNDTKVEQNWLKPLVEYLDKNLKTAVLQPKILLMDKKNSFDYAGAAGGFIDKYGYPFTRGRIFDTIEKDRGQYDNVSNIFWASGAAFIIRRSVIDKVGGLFSENLFNYMEEIDLCWRIWNRGYNIKFCPRSVVYHKGAATSKKNVIKKRFWEHRNNLFILTRNLDRKNLLKILIPRFFLESATYLGYMIRGEYKYLVALSAAHLDYLRKFVLVRYKRARLPNKNNLPIYQGSIVLDYYLRNKKYYSEIIGDNKNISYLLFNTKGSGGLNAIIKQAKQLQNKDYKVNFYTVIPGKISIQGFRIQNLQKFILSSHDVAMATFWPSSYIATLSRSKKKLYFVQDFESDFHNNALLKRFADLSYKLPIQKIVISKYLKNRLRTNGVKRNVHKITYSVLEDKYLNNYQKRSLNSKKIRVLSVISRYNQHKGIDILDMVVSKLKQKCNNYEFTLVSMEDKPYSGVFDKFVSKADQSKMTKLYRDSDVLLATSRSEGFFIPGLEAMASGCVFVTSDCNGINEYAVNGKNAVIYKNVEQLWEEGLIEKSLDKKNRDKLIKTGLITSRKFISDRLSSDLIKVIAL